ncbi:MAG: 5-formyltetrahydrofolate cyclo-ligase [Spirochaetaceae bacterium]|jgi:5-formyltetrahydrofolate cyclo-ligase|nr:5-formyltetrahydrofolate cyclo-ligase [Spirochaetaceae bacterium]
MLSKDSERKALKEKLASLDRGFFSAEGEAAAALLSKEKIFSQTKNLLLFMSLPGEIDTSPLLRLAFSHDKKVFLPRVEEKEIRFYRILSPSGPWQKGPFGIQEPRPHQPLSGEDFPALIVVPGLAFDRRGRRLGRGRAYYDRFFAGLPDIFSAPVRFFALGYCTSAQLVPELPVDPWDRPMDGLCTGKEFLRLETP